ncbi:MAG: signal peptidase I [Bacillota bacterium]
MDRTVRDILETVVAALVIAVLVRGFIIEPYVVNGPSMEPTLWTGERLFISKLAYRFGQPKRGDIVMFRYPLNPEKDYVKRVVAIPGDTVEMRMGRVYINGQQVSEPFVQFPGLYNMSPQVVPAGSVFVMGDNRANSEDSRAFGPVKLSLVRGKAVFRVWPLKTAGFLK